MLFVLQVPSSFSSNGDAFASHYNHPGDGEETETQFPLSDFPSPENLWIRYKKARGIKPEDEKLVVQPYYTDGSGKEPRYTRWRLLTALLKPWQEGRTGKP